jgi:hypothetical protein
MTTTSAKNVSRIGKSGWTRRKKQMSGDHNKYRMKIEFPERHEEQRMHYLQDLLDSDEFKYALGTIADYAISKDLLRARDRMVDDYERAVAGIVTNVFVMGDAKKDAKKLKKYIKAYDLILDMYTVNHIFYDFNHED